MKGKLVMLIVGLVLGSTGVALGQQNKSERYVTARVGDSIYVPAVDLYCAVWRSDPDHHEVGPFLYCNRSSASNQGEKSRAIGASRYHYLITNATGQYQSYRVSRSP
jgi:hypothetical protein